jgi:hypothetical protein
MMLVCSWRDQDPGVQSLVARDHSNFGSTKRDP